MQQGLQQPSNGTNAYLPIEDYAIIGDLYTVALVGKNGSIDWCCLPQFDAPSVFGALLDAQKGGFFRITPPAMPGIDQKQMYLPGTNMLVTRFLTSDGVGEVIDFMPIKQLGSSLKEHQIIRAVHVIHGALSFEIVCRPAFNYARDAHIVRLAEQGAVFQSDGLSLCLSSSVPLTADEQGGVYATVTLQEGQSAYFLLESSGTHDLHPHIPTPAEYEEYFTTTKRYWRNWLLQCQYQGRWREAVERSALALKLLTYAPTGAIVAAATTSLPEGIGGERNWDYRYTWLRDSSFTLDSLLMLGYTQEAEDFANWLTTRVRELGEGGSIQPMYTIDGGHDIKEYELGHLEGYRQSRPVRIGNGAYSQKQLDVYGELMDATYILSHHRGIYYDGWTKLVKHINWLGQHWQEPDEGIWEVRGGQREFVHSRLMSWVAFDRALRIASEHGLPAPTDAWTAFRGQIYQEIMERGWNQEKQCFVQYYGSDALDAGSLLMSITGFIGPTDPRMLHTIQRIQKELTRTPHVYRYQVDQAANDGLAGKEGTFNICSFWLVEALARAGHVEEATNALEQLLTYANHAGLYAEEIGSSGEALGNFPQAFTHLSLISACHHVDQAVSKATHLSFATTS